MMNKKTRPTSELKTGEAKDSSISQITRYAGWYVEKEGNPPRAILLARAKAISGLKLVIYLVQFNFKEMTVLQK